MLFVLSVRKISVGLVLEIGFQTHARDSSDIADPPPPPCLLPPIPCPSVLILSVRELSHCGHVTNR